MTHPPGLQIYLRPRMTLNFNLMTPKVHHFMSLPCEPLVPIGIKKRFIRVQNIVFTCLVTDEQTDGQTDGRTG